MYKLPIAIALLGLVHAVRPANAQTLPAATPEQIRAELPARLRELDSPRYETRSLAARSLERWVRSPELADVLAAEFQRYALQPELPMEVRWQIALWRGHLPVIHVEPPHSVSPQELDQLIEQLDDDAYSVREGASQRLQWLAGSEQLAGPILLALKRRLAEPAPSQELFLRIESIRRVAWGMWLESDSGTRFLPAVSAAQISHWLDDLAPPKNQRDARSSLRSRVARQGLMDALSQDAEAPRVKAAIEARLRGKLEHDAIDALQELLDLTRPAIVIEYWSDRKMLPDRFRLFIGKETKLADATHPTQFDRADDQTAHCVCGNSLTAKDYDVGVAFAAPYWPAGQPETVFHIVNLPTPRRQIAYSYYVKSDQAARLAKISRRTLDRLLAEKKLLRDDQLGMLAQLDAGEVSRFAARYFFAVNDGPPQEDDGDSDYSYSTSRKHLGSQGSCFASICMQLAIDGTRDSVPGLLDAIRQSRFEAPSAPAPYRVEWLAAFSIARRDPWTGVDTWLAENIENKLALVFEHADSPLVGATAAAALLERHHEQPSAFGLQAAFDQHMLALKVPGYRYAGSDGAARVRTWWAKQAEIAKKESR